MLAWLLIASVLRRSLFGEADECNLPITRLGTLRKVAVLL